VRERIVRIFEAGMITAPNDSTLEMRDVYEALRQNQDARIGLMYVPDVVRAVEHLPVDRVHAVLRECSSIAACLSCAPTREASSFEAKTPRFARRGHARRCSRMRGRTARNLGRYVARSNLVVSGERWDLEWDQLYFTHADAT